MAMSTKEIFYKVKNHLLEQGEKSETSPGGDCVLRTKEGLSCAIGCLIPENKYFPELEDCTLEGTELSEALNHVVGVAPKKVVLKQLLLGVLMRVHDEYDVDEWEYRLERVKEEFGIS
jgi:hypothetical protein